MDIRGMLKKLAIEMSFHLWYFAKYGLKRKKRKQR